MKKKRKFPLLSKVKQMESEEEILQRHRKEQRQLVEKTTSMKKGASKSTRKQINKQIIELEDSLKFKQQQELKQLLGEEEELSPEELLAQMDINKKEETIETTVLEPQQGAKKRNRQKERLAKRQAKFDEMTQEAANEALNQIDYRQIELDGLEIKCKELNVRQFDIKSDGHCLFNSISDQLLQRHGIKVGYLDLRKEAGEYIRKNKDDFIPFLFNEQTGELEDIDEYIESIITTARWGSDLEVLALSKVYNCPISVLQNDQPIHLTNKDGVNDELKLVYYKYIFGLGEHYGSLHDL